MMVDWDDLSGGEWVVGRGGEVYVFLRRRAGWSQVRGEDGTVRAFRVSGAVEVVPSDGVAGAIHLVGSVVPVSGVWNVCERGGWEENRSLLGVARLAYHG